jgi:hypothetical protein
MMKEATAVSTTRDEGSDSGLYDPQGRPDFHLNQRADYVY